MEVIMGPPLSEGSCQLLTGNRITIIVPIKLMKKMFSLINNNINAKMYHLKSQGPWSSSQWVDELTKLFNTNQLGHKTPEQITNLLHFSFFLLSGVRNGVEQNINYEKNICNALKTMSHPNKLEKGNISDQSRLLCWDFDLQLQCLKVIDLFPATIKLHWKFRGSMLSHISYPISPLNHSLLH